MTKYLRIPRIVWAAMLVQPVVLGIVLSVVETSPDEVVTTMAPVLALMALGELGFIAYWRWQQFGRTLGFAAPDLLRVQERASQAELEAAVAKVAPQFMTSVLVGCAISMSIALFGFVLGFIGGSLLYFLPFAAVGMLGIAVQFPSFTALGCMLGEREAKTLFDG